MKIQECMLLFSLGLILWISGTIYYAYAGHGVLETTRARYWASFAISPIVSSAFCILILLWRHIAPSDRKSRLKTRGTRTVQPKPVHLLSNIAAGARAKIVYERLINFSDDPGTNRCWR